MLEFVRGKVVRVTANRVVVEVGGLGLSLHATPAALAELRVGAEATIDAALIVREDAFTLFGFGSPAERELFELLQTVSGVGPKLALTILSAITPTELAAALANGDEARLVRIPGVGKKSAARLIVELGDRLPKTQTAPATWQSDVSAALRSLGWSEKDSESAVEVVAKTLPADTDSASALRAALQALGARK